MQLACKQKPTNSWQSWQLSQTCIPESDTFQQYLHYIACAKSGLCCSTGIREGGVEITPFGLGMSKLSYEA